jgi:hypothetical protein
MSIMTIYDINGELLVTVITAVLTYKGTRQITMAYTKLSPNLIMVKKTKVKQYVQMDRHF